MGTWPGTYIEKVALAVYHASGETDSCYPADENALWLGYAVLALAKGTDTTSEDVHDAWSAWAIGHYPFVHRSVVPFHELTPDVQAYDDMYRDGIHKVAREMDGRSSGEHGRVVLTIDDAHATRHAVEEAFAAGFRAGERGGRR